MTRILLSLAILALGAGEASAQVAASARKVARELVQFLKKPFAREVMEEGAEKLESRFAYAISRHGDDVVAAAKRMGPRTALRIVEQHGASGAKILVRFGDDGARLLATDAVGTKTVFRNLGEEGVELMLKRRGEITAARLPDLAAAIKASGQPREVLAVLRKYGDPACAFIWKNKGVLAGGALLAAFLANPTPYINGAKQLVDVPMSHIAAATDWTAVFLAIIVITAAIASFRMFVLRRSGSVAKTAGSE